MHTRAIIECQNEEIAAALWTTTPQTNKEENNWSAREARIVINLFDVVRQH